MCKAKRVFAKSLESGVHHVLTRVQLYRNGRIDLHSCRHTVRHCEWPLGNCPAPLPAASVPPSNVREAKNEGGIEKQTDEPLLIDDGAYNPFGNRRNCPNKHISVTNAYSYFQDDPPQIVG